MGGGRRARVKIPDGSGSNRPPPERREGVVIVNEAPCLFSANKRGRGRGGDGGGSEREGKQSLLDYYGIH